MIYLILTILSSSAISIFMRCSERHISGKLPLLSANYLVCTLLALWQSGGTVLTLPQTQTAATLALGVVNGIIFFLTLLLTQHTMFQCGVVLPSVFSKMGSLVVPLVVAIGLFHEVPTALQICGAALCALAIFLLNSGSAGTKTVRIALLMLLFVMQGTASAMSKVFAQLIGTALSGHFLFYTFAAALILSGTACVIRKEVPGKWELLFGLLIGIPNFFSSRLLLLALEALPAVIVYPIMGVSGIVVVSLAGIILFRERLRKRQWLGILTVLAAVLLLNL